MLIRLVLITAINYLSTTPIRALRQPDFRSVSSLAQLIYIAFGLPRAQIFQSTAALQNTCTFGDLCDFCRSNFQSLGKLVVAFGQPGVIENVSNPWCDHNRCRFPINLLGPRDYCGIPRSRICSSFILIVARRSWITRDKSPSRGARFDLCLLFYTPTNVLQFPEAGPCG